MTEIQEKLFEIQDEKYKNFQGSLIPGGAGLNMIGVRTPQLRSLAKEMVKSGEADNFINELPHSYFEENQLHAFIICQIKDYRTCVEEIDRFLPYVDNWATCDQMNPKALKKDIASLNEKIKEWIASDETYTVRFGVKCFMNFFLDEHFDKEQLDIISGIKSDEYYVKMMVAWYFATALAKQYDATIGYFEKRVLPEWTHRKAIQKAVESNRISDEKKAYLRTLK